MVDKFVCGGSMKKMVARVRKMQIVLWLEAKSHVLLTSP